MNDSNGKIVEIFNTVYGYTVDVGEKITNEDIIEETDVFINKGGDDKRQAVYLTMNIIYRMRKIKKDHCI